VRGAPYPSTEARQRDEFVDLICADADLLRAEFEAIVAAGWSNPPPSPPAGRPAERSRSAEARPDPREPRLGCCQGLDNPAADGRSRQRSPPLH
jgi:hypothetical protein